MVLHLTEHHGDGAPGAAMMIQTKGIEALHRKLTDWKYGYARPGLEDQPWGARTINVTAPFANKLTFSETKD